MTLPAERPAYVGEQRPDEAVDQPPPPGQMPLVMTGLAIGLLLMAIQLWLLTIALELYLGGEGGVIWQIALISGVIFLGGLAMLRLLRRRPRTPGRIPAAGTRRVRWW
jgi:hypothetical protein